MVNLANTHASVPSFACLDVHLSFGDYRLSFDESSSSVVKHVLLTAHPSTCWTLKCQQACTPSAQKPRQHPHRCQQCTQSDAWVLHNESSPFAGALPQQDSPDRLRTRNLTVQILHMFGVLLQDANLGVPRKFRRDKTACCEENIGYQLENVKFLCEFLADVLCNTSRFNQIIKLNQVLACDSPYRSDLSIK